MSNERGLSPVTVRRRVERAHWFLLTPREHRRSLAATSVADVDELLASKGSAGWTHASIDVLASSLRRLFRFACNQHWCAADIAALVERPRIFAQEGSLEGCTACPAKAGLFSRNWITNPRVPFPFLCSWDPLAPRCLNLAARTCRSRRLRIPVARDEPEAADP